MSSLFDAIQEERDASSDKAEVASASQPELELESQVVDQDPVKDAESEGGDSGGSEKTWGLRSWLAQAGFDPDELEELDDEELDRFTRERLSGGGEPPTQPTDGGATRPATDGKQVESPSIKEETKQDPPAPVKEATGDELTKLEYDYSISQLVKQEGGKYVPIDDTPEAVAAAKEANGYNRKRQDRLNKILDDPKGTLGPWMRQEMEALVSQKLKDEMEQFRKSQEEARQIEVRQRTEQEELDRYESLRDQHKASLYKLSDSGEIRRSLRTGQLMMTSFGREVNKNLLELAELSPHQPRSVLLQKAIQVTSKYMKPEVSDKPKAEATNKRQTFLDKARKADVDTDVSKRPASVQEAVALGTNMSLLEAILSDPDNQDNPTVQKLKSSR